jgi:hypothetical protein
LYGKRPSLLHSEKQPSLGFKCHGCGKDYGTLCVEVRENRNTKERPISQRRESGLRPERRENLKPIQYSWKNQIASESYVVKIKEALTVTKQALHSELLTDVQKQEILKECREALQPIIERYKAYEIEDQQDSKWDVYDENGKLLWNPVRMIKQYREQGDPFYHMNNLPFLFIAKVLKKYPLSFNYTRQKISNMMKGLEFFVKYIQSIAKQNWHYSLYEWWIILAYEDTEGIGKTRRMLEALDGSRGKISRKEIRTQSRRLKKVAKDLRFMIDFFEFLKYIERTAQKDPELRIEWDRIKEDKKQGRFNYWKRINEGTKHADSSITTILDNKLISFKSEVIRIYHGYNPNYKSEIRDYRLKLADLHKQLHTVSYPTQNENRRNKIKEEIKRLEASKPKQKDQCGPFHPSKLPIEVIDSLRNQRKLCTLDFF